MASKLHCDVCDSVEDVKDVDERRVRLTNPNNMRQDIKVHLVFEKLGRGDDDERKRELCLECRRKAIVEVASLLGIKVSGAPAELEFPKALRDF